MAPMGDEEIEVRLAAVKPAEPTTPLEVTWLCADVEAAGMNLNRVRIWVEDKGGWGFFDKQPPYFEVPDTKAPEYDPDAVTNSVYEGLSTGS